MADAKLLKHFRRLSYYPGRRDPHRSRRDVAKRFERIGEPLFRKWFEVETGEEIPSTFNVKHLAENVFFCSMTDLDRKIRRIEYYKSHAYLFIRYMAEICEKTRLSGDFADGRINNYLFQAQALLQRHSWYISRNGFDYGVYRTDHTQYYRLFWDSQRLIKYEPVDDINIGAASLRLCIESRIRAAIGVFGIYSPAKHEIFNVSMKDLLGVLKKYRHEIEIDVSLDLVVLVYKWSNNFIHTAHHTFPWLISFAHEILRPLFNMADLGETRDITASIRMREETLHLIRADIMAPHLAKDPNCNIHGYAPEDCSIGRL